MNMGRADSKGEQMKESEAEELLMEIDIDLVDER
eukprot:CAMPEP_0168622026 /NCGR_PEP_ID=MMETSP0449_2-20121227/8028_1 /TAXON_ID=1082188 /ORGANISM="Strombidium rassoulzadegani, Strain ras09" /LENGTH=33 /DNA_ID= /DNA_START= /DNA_END= /DNA_ORIENTATION=